MSEIINRQVDNVKDIEVIMPMCNLIIKKHRGVYGNTIEVYGSLCEL